MSANILASSGPQIARERFAHLVLLSLLPLLSLFAPASSTAENPPETSVSNAVIQATLSSKGSYRLIFIRTGWALEGKLSRSAGGVTVSPGSDHIGSFREISLGFLHGSRTASMRVYDKQPIVLLEDHWNQTGMNKKSFPEFHAIPNGLMQFSYRRTEFSPYEFGKLGSEGPWALFDENKNTILISPADQFLISRMQQHGGRVSSGILPEIRTVPAGFSHRTLITVGDGINQAFNSWGDALLALSGNHRRANDADVVLSQLGYWTDNGATYYYKYDNALGYQGTLLAVRDEFKRAGVPLGYMQIDSWWYPKGIENRWDAKGSSLNFGEYEYRADSTLFSQGLASFQKVLALPLATHARWISPASPYHAQFRMSDNVVIDPRYWQDTASYLHDSGVVMFEQDWLNENALPQLNLDDPKAFLGNMSSAMHENNLSIQYCMPLPSHYMVSTQYSNVATIRTSGDRFDRNRWDSFLYGSRLATAVGLWPWTDVFNSDELPNLVISVLSGGPAGVGDALGHVNAVNLKRAIRADGLIMKPDTSLLPIDAMYIADSRNQQSPMIAEAETNFGAASAKYIFAYSRKNLKSQTLVSLHDVGIAGPVFAYDWQAGRGEMIPIGGSVSLAFTEGWDYKVLVPVTSTGIAFIGEADKIVSLARRRISRLELGESIIASITLAPSETSVMITGYSPRQPRIQALMGSVDHIAYAPATGIFKATIYPSSEQTARIAISN